MYFDTPYYLEPEKKWRHAYALLRESLREANKVGIARVVIRSREHLAALKPNGEALVLELMHYSSELVNQDDFDFPSLREDVAPAELKVAKMLIDTMSSEKFEPDQFHDKYKEDVMAMIEARAAGKEIPEEPVKRVATSNVVNLMDVLQRSLEQSSKRRGAAAASDEDDGESGSKRTGAKKKSATAAKPKRKKSAA